jgi:hypothetical protein
MIIRSPSWALRSTVPIGAGDSLIITYPFLVASRFADPVRR